MSKDYYTSVSLAVLVCANERLKDAHRQSVNEAIKYCEEYMQARGALAPGNGQHHKDETEIENDLTTDPNALDIKL